MAEPVDLARMTAELHALRDETIAAAEAAPDSAALEAMELDVLGKKGRLTAVLRGIGALPAEDRPKVGAIANEVRIAVEGAIATAARTLGSKELDARLAAERLDVTTPGRPIRRGSLHPINETIGAIAEVFGQFGFVAYEGPEVEDDTTNFRMLNIPPDHPARDLWDTLYVDLPDHLLRTHTSPGQIRVMHQERPPIRALLPGRCFRYEAVDASHASEFFQVEGLMVDEGTTMADLKGLLDQFAHAMFGADRATRFRPGYYPFTEPRVAFDILCVICDGAECPACSKTGWMTILGAGMVHPVVLALRRHRSGALPGLRVRDGRGADRESPPRGPRPPRLFLATTCASWGEFAMTQCPLRWLVEFVDVELDPEALAERLTLLGMEVKTIERWGDDWQQVVVGELLDRRQAPACRPPVADHRHPGRRDGAAGDRVRRDQHRAGAADPGRAAGGRPARRPAHRARREDGRGQQRDAVLRRGAPPDRRRRRHPDPARGHAAGRPARRHLWRHRPGRGRQAQSRRRALHPGPGARGLRRHWRAGPLGGAASPGDAGASTAERLAVEVDDAGAARGSSVAGSTA